MQKIFNSIFRKKDSESKVIHDKFEMLLVLINPITQIDFEFISTAMRCGEEWIALEILCEQIYDHQIPISKEVYVLINELAKIMNISGYYLNLITPLILTED